MIRSIVARARAPFLATSALFVAFAAFAGDPWNGCDFSAGVSCPGMKISICPGGDFEAVGKGCGGSEDYIWIEVRDAYLRPIAGIPATDYWIGSCSGSTPLFLCAPPLVADSATGSNGRTTISGNISAGGCVPAGGIWIAVAGITVMDPACNGQPLCLPVVVKGPDLTGPRGHPDGVVNLSDLIPFGMGYNKDAADPAFNPCCDYNDDARCNLSDFTLFSVHYQHACR